jgi:parallel beta-helix repeat protein
MSILKDPRHGSVSSSRSDLAKPRARRFRPQIDRVEGRVLLSTFTVANLNDSGAGSLRQAILDSNAALDPGPELIDFTVAGTIALTSAALPAIIHPVDIDGTTAPGFTQTPVVEVDYNGFDGLVFASGSVGASLKSLALIDSDSNGITLDDRDITVVGNDVGVELDGTTAAGNADDGLEINATSTSNTIGAATSVGSSVLPLASNVISGNGLDGIAIHGSTGNTLIANYIGTDVSGKLPLGNGGNGITLDDGAQNNLIGGVIPFVNSNGAVPHSNLISGNSGDGVFITGGSSANTLASNFIGTNVTGNAPLGNDGDGVAILDGAHDNTLVGTTLTQSPFIFANIVSGNHGNGLRIQDSNNDVIQANFFGLGYNNETPVPNALDGVLIEGSSANTQFGGVIPLGNVAAANSDNGVEIRDTASGTVVFNTFAGLAAFEDYSNLGNGQDGMLITSTGGNNIIRTNVVANNHANGIEITGNATGVQVTQAIIGMNTDGTLALPNAGNGVVIGGRAHGNTIGGFQQSVIPQNIISANLGHGVAIIGTANNNLVINSYIGTDVLGKVAFGNAGAGVFLGPGTSANTIGGTGTNDRNLISGNLGNGIELSDTNDNSIIGNQIGTDSAGNPMLNGGNGIFLIDSSNNTIGGVVAGSGNTIAFNAGAGVFISSGTGDAILGNSIYNNLNGGIVLLPGANANQNAPRLTRVNRSRRRTVISGVLRGAANATYRVEYFSNTSINLPRTAGGQTFLGFQVVRTNSRGIANVRFFAPTQSRRAFFTATATSAADNTSPFSNDVPTVRISGKG